MAKAGRPLIDLNQKVRDLLQHTLPTDSGVDAPIRNFEERANAALNLIKYVDDHLATQSIYQAVYDRHMALLHRRMLGCLIEAFERFVKELAIVCVDAIADYIIDDRFDEFTASGGSLAIQFSTGTVGRALCESSTWLSNKSINDRFRQILKPHFGELWKFLFPKMKQEPASERDRAATLAILWQVRHNITHNTGLLTDSDARRLTLMVKKPIPSGTLLNPSSSDLRYVKRFLSETADHTNLRVGQRLADLLTELHSEDSTRFDAQVIADAISVNFQKPLTVANFNGKP